MILSLFLKVQKTELFSGSPLNLLSEDVQWTEPNHKMLFNHFNDKTNIHLLPEPNFLLVTHGTITYNK